MKFSCEKALLKEAVNTASRVAAQKSSIQALEGLLLQAGSQLSITGYNMQTGIRTLLDADITEAGSIVLNAKLFGDIIYKMPDDMVVFSADDKMTVHLSCGNADYEIMGLSAEDYPELPSVEETNGFSMQQRTMKAMIDQTLFAVSTNSEIRPIQTGMLFEIKNDSLTMVAVDGFRLAYRKEPLEKTGDNQFSFVAPSAALGEVQKICNDVDDPIFASLGKRHISFKMGDTQLICRQLDGEFLDYQTAIPRKNPIILTVDKKNLIESVDRVSVLISEKLKSPVRCLFEQDQVTLSAKTANGISKDICHLSGDGNHLEIGFNNRYLIEALRHAPADTVRIELNTNVSPAVIVPADEQENFLYMILPVRLEAQD